jgi:hypothetical protein
MSEIYYIITSMWRGNIVYFLFIKMSYFFIDAPFPHGFMKQNKQEMEP